ncbi:MAG TPA: hypothetical protein VHB53_10055 [Solirubrobacterales bacterium]|nr:hypothetical protein [Solirubrobacterales bacterium]
MWEMTETYLYCRPDVLATESGQDEVDLVLQKLAGELGLTDGPLFREGRGTSIVVPGSPETVWAAMDRVSINRTRRELFVLPGPGDSWPRKS